MNFLLKKINWKLFLPAFLLTVLGLISIQSISQGDNLQKQLIFFAFSLLIALVVSFFDFRFFRTNSRLILIIYFIGVLLLGGLFFFGSEIRGVKGWYKMGPISFDPVPVMAVVLIIVLSKYFSTRHIETKRFQPILFSLFYLLIPFILILLQPDLGSALVLICIWIGIIVFSGLEFRHFLILGLIALILLGLAWGFWLEDYQKERIYAFLKPNLDPQGASWNVNQSKIAIGNGGLLGEGINKGSQTQYGFLPETSTDFIFSTIAEEEGFLGVFLLIFLFIFLFFQMIKIVFRKRDNFTRLFAVGFILMIFSQSTINIGMALGLLPIIGIPLPFVSYGGSQLLGFYLGLGILSSLSRH